MKRTKKALAVLLALTLLFSLCVTSAFAANIKQDGLEVTLITEKEEYKADEAISATATVKNTNDSAVTDVNVKINAPEGYDIKDAEKNIAELKKNDELVLKTELNVIVKDAPAPAQTELKNEAKAEKEEAPKTGDSNIAVFAVLFAFAVAGAIGVFALKSKKGKRIVSLALSLTLALSAFALLSSPALAQEKEQSKITLAKTVKVDEKDVSIDVVVTYNKAEKATLKLTSSETQVAIGMDENNEVLFFAQGNKNLKDVTLYSADKKVAKMLDDGKNGDKKANDGIYTAKVQIDNTKAQDLVFYASSAEAVSENVKIKVYEKLKDEELKSMEDTDTEIEKLVDNEEFDKLPIDEKKEKAEDLLTNEVESGNIVKDSVLYDENNEMYTFEYGCGILGGIMLKDFDQNSGLKAQQFKPQVESKVNFNLLESADSTALKNAIHSNAVIYYAFDPYYFSPRAPYYKDIQREWPNVGVNPKLDTRVTVNDLKKMDAYDIIVFSTHGTYFNGQDFQNPVVCLRDRAGFFKDLYYSADLREHRIVKVNRQYWVCPSFIDYYYRDGQKLKNKMVFSESCCFMGEYGKVDSSFADSLINSGVPTVIGFHNSVYAVYSVDFMDLYIKTLAKGETASAAFTVSRDTYGMNDYEWAVEHQIEDARPENYAYPIMSGAPFAKLRAFNQ